MGFKPYYAGIDLHIHSTASDGTFSPSEILAIASKKQLGAISITDHDTIKGNRKALCHGIPAGLNFLTGVEISTSPPPTLKGVSSIHILGYGMDIENAALNQTLTDLQQSRTERNPKIISRLNALGIDISLETVKKEAGDCQLGRPHIARSLVKHGVVGTIDEAFDKLLGKGKTAYVEKFRISIQQAIRLILDAGGLPVLAHPFLLGLTDPDYFEQFLTSLLAFGLKGIEVYYPEHPPEYKVLYTKLAKQYNLIITGGTDFHGAIKPEIQIGSGTGDFFVPYELFEKIVAACN